jgi:hypothetical protein
VALVIEEALVGSPTTPLRLNQHPWSLAEISQAANALGSTADLLTSRIEQEEMIATSMTRMVRPLEKEGGIEMMMTGERNYASQPKTSIEGGLEALTTEATRTAIMMSLPNEKRESGQMAAIIDT